jgi:hypothetical protein
MRSASRSTCPPAVFDGLAAARGRLHVALESGQLVCMGPKRKGE